jgi:hypothetical protein
VASGAPVQAVNVTRAVDDNKFPLLIDGPVFAPSLPVLGVFLALLGPRSRLSTYSMAGPAVSGSDRGKTVTKPLRLIPLGLALSEKQIPQVIEKFESGGKRKEAS